MQKRKTNIAERLRNTPLWLIVVAVALLGITVQSLTGDGSIGALLVLLLFVIVSVKLLWFGTGLLSLLFKIILIILVLSYWLLSMAGF